jgi:hypothetical protein
MSSGAHAGQEHHGRDRDRAGDERGTECGERYEAEDTDEREGPA